MRLLAFADLHLKPDRLEDQRGVLERIAELAEERDVDAVLFAGDLFDGPLHEPACEDAIGEFIGRVYGDRKIPVFACLGNSRHDLASRDKHALTIFKRIPGITVFDQPCIHPLYQESRIRAYVACLPWTPVGQLVATHGGGDRDRIHEHAADLLIEIARGLRADIPQGVPAILLLHWSISGASLPNGLAIDEHAREPILPLHELEALGFDAIVAGHIHKPQMMESHIGRAAGPIFYCGSPLPLSFGEADVQHGCWILDIDHYVRPEFIEIPSRPFVTVGLSIDDTHGWSLDGGGVADAYVRVRYTATEGQNRLIDRHAVERALYDAGAHRVVSITPDIVRQKRARADAAIEDLSPVETVRAWVSAQEFERAEQIVAAAAPYLETA